MSLTNTTHSDIGQRVERKLRLLLARTRHRLRLPVQDPGAVEFSARFRHPVEEAQRARVVAGYEERFPHAVLSELADAGRLVAHRFTLLGHTMDHGERIAWSRDPVTLRDWDRGFSQDIVYRGDGRLGDIKLPWELSKHQYFFTLGKAAWLTDDDRLSREIVHQITHWIADNPYERGIHWISALEAGARAISWILAWPFYAGVCEESVRSELARSLAQHMVFVENHLSLGRGANTHLVGEAAALVAGGLFLECRHSARWLARGRALLETQIVQQVTSDGVHAERSVSYHRYFLDHYHVVQALLGANGESLSSDALRTMEHMTEFLLDVVRRDGSVPAFGDGDNGRGMWLHAQSAHDYRGLLALGALMFGRGDFKRAAGEQAEEILWLKGASGLAAYDKLPACEPDHTSRAYAEGGYFLMRGGWGEADAQLAFDCGPLGYGAAGHGHADALSFQLFAGGYPWFVDSGTYSYNLDYAWRDAFRGTRAHNTITVDGQDQSVPGDRMSWRSEARARLHRWTSTAAFDLADGEHDGYRRLPDPVTHRRVIVFFKPDLWVVCDRLQASEPHDIELLLHLMPDCKVRFETDGVILTAPSGKSLHLWTGDAQGAYWAPELFRAEAGAPAAWYSPAYGRRMPSRMLHSRCNVAGTCLLVSAFSTVRERMPSIRGAAGGVHVVTRRDGQPEYWHIVIGDDAPASVRCGVTVSTGA